MTKTPTGRPLPPSLVRELATYVAAADAGCGHTGHADAIRAGHACPSCRLVIGDYANALAAVRLP